MQVSISNIINLTPYSNYLMNDTPFFLQQSIIIIQHWATKDGCGMIGGLVFSYYSSPYFDSYIKEFRLFADIINDVGLTLDMIAPYVPKSYLIYISISATICRSLCGIAAGATKGSITEHFSKHNMADLNAKEGTQETLVSLIGMIFGIVLANMIQNMETKCHVFQEKSFYSYSAVIATWYIFILLTLIHVWANYVAVKVLRLRSLNRQRAETILYPIVSEAVEFMGDIDNWMNKEVTSKMEIERFFKNSDIMSPSECNESLWKSVQSLLFPGQIHLCVKLSRFLQNMSHNEIESVFDLFRDEKYCIQINSQSFVISVILHLDATEEDQLKAFVHTFIVKHCIHRKIIRVDDEESRIQLITR